MIIKSLDIKNFRCFESLSFDLGLLQGLIGENGTGKTAILEALNLVTSSSYLSSRINEQDFHNSDSGDIEVSLEFDKPFISRVADGYTYQDIPCSGVKLDIKRRKKLEVVKRCLIHLFLNTTLYLFLILTKVI